MESLGTPGRHELKGSKSPISSSGVETRGTASLLGAEPQTLEKRNHRSIRRLVSELWRVIHQ